MITIYALADISVSPALIRYVGRSGDAEARLKQHWDGRFADEKPLHLWLRELSSAPLLILLAEVSADDAVQAENYFIATLRQGGVPLLNGDGGPGAWGRLAGRAVVPRVRRREPRPPEPITANWPPLRRVHRHDIGLALLIADGVVTEVTVDAESLREVTEDAYAVYRDWWASRWPEADVPSLTAFSVAVSEWRDSHTESKLNGRVAAVMRTGELSR